MDRVKRLLEFGYFPSQLPPCFVTKDLANHYSALYKDWLALQDTPKKIPKSPATKSETFSVARAGLQRRITSITNPVAQTYLATHVAQHWGEILKHYRQSKMSSSKPRFLKAGGRAANIPSMHNLYDQKISKSAGYRFMLRSDISRFFPTIYTHSVPWAIHGKAVSKKHMNPTPKYFGNLIDMSLRQCQDGQTIGLPIGPDTSHIIAELISTSIDVELKKKLKGFPVGFRYVDDYYFFFSTLNEAETALASLVKALQDYELQINFEKTKICSVHEIADDYWTHQLRSFEITKSGQKQVSDIHHFFELAKSLARQNADESVMTYALLRACSVLIKKENWSIFESHVCHIALAFSNTLQTIARLFSTYHKVGYPINVSRLSRVINTIIEDHAPLGHHSEVVWCLWMCKEIGLTLSQQNIDRVSEIQSSVCALILMDLYYSGKLLKAPKMTLWKSTETSDALFDELWLLSYEAGLRSWGGLSDVHILENIHFRQLHAKRVHFYDPNASIKPFFHPDPGALAAKKLTIAEIFEREDADEFLKYDNSGGGYEGVSVDGDDDENVFENLDRPT
jgi:hypothetical protein